MAQCAFSKVLCDSNHVTATFPKMSGLGHKGSTEPFYSFLKMLRVQRRKHLPPRVLDAREVTITINYKQVIPDIPLLVLQRLTELFARSRQRLRRVPKAETKSWCSTGMGVFSAG